MALPVQRPVNVKYYGATLSTMNGSVSVFAAVAGRGQLVGARCAAAGTITVDATLSLLVNGVTAVGSTTTQTASGSTTGSVTSINCTPTPVNDGDRVELRKAGAGTTAQSMGVTFIVRETTA